MRIFRSIAVLGAILFLLPAPPEEATRLAQDDLTTPKLILAASEAVSDIGNFCGRQPGVCDAAEYVAARIEIKAKYSVRILYEWANEAGSDVAPSPVNEADAIDPPTTSSITLASAGSKARTHDATLKLEDLIPEWRDPASPPTPQLKG